MHIKLFVQSNKGVKNNKIYQKITTYISKYVTKLHYVLLYNKKLVVKNHDSYVYIVKK